MRSWPSPDIPRLPEDAEKDSTALRVINPRTGQWQELASPGGQASMYVCGITPYDATHLGHAFTYLIFDLVNRVWRDLGVQVVYVQNVTDIDEPLLERAEETKVDWVELGSGQTDLFRTDMMALRVIAPQYYVAATEVMEEVAELVSLLIDSGSVYAIDDVYPDLYFRCSTSVGFGEVSGLDREAMLVDFARKGGDPERPGKEDALDALVWRCERPGEPSWTTILGRGRPGWHIECTAIALSRLGNTMTVQGGGRDLAFPHHEISAAQGFAATGEPFSLAYVHGGMVGLDGEKMSKSRGNLEFVSRLREQGVDPMAIRLALLSHHYATDWEWTSTQIGAAQRRLDAWRSAVKATRGPEAFATVRLVRKALRNDLDAPMALRLVDEWSSAALAGEGDDPDAPTMIADLVDALLGIQLRR